MNIEFCDYDDDVEVVASYTPPTSDITMIELLHCIGCESPTGSEHMGMLLALTGISQSELDASIINLTGALLE